ncbi:MAG: M23 family metallopeptidase [Bacteroides sp.]|nr:M23 family metallopeptidase [Bacteroides sp.]
MRKKIRRRAFWHNIKFKYRLTIVNENTLEEVAGLHVSKLNGLSVLLCACTVIFLTAAVIIAFTPLRNYLPGYINSDVRRQIVENALRADSLQQALDRQNRYMMTVRDILSGRVKTDTVASLDSLTDARAEQLMERSREEEEFRRRYEEEERYNLTAVTGAHDAAGMVFFRPLRAAVAVPFNPADKHFGVDLAAGPREGVMAALDGTVVLAAYIAGEGRVVMIQHAQNFLTVYRHCGGLMCASGDQVKGGDVIALTQDRKDADGGSHPFFHFELWHGGVPVDPARYVVF